MSVLPKFSWPVPSNNRGSDFANQDDVMSHLEGEPTGWYLLGSNGMWHGGIHITSATTPWCALSGKAASESVDFPVEYKGEQAVRCMADGEVVAYRICRDYLDVPWETGPLNVSGSFVLVRHFIQPGEKKESGLHFYTLYMHLAPYSAYAPSEGESQWTVNDNLSAYRPEWVMSASTDNKEVSDSYRVATIPKGAHVGWDATDSNLHTIGHNGRRYGLVTFKGLSDKAKAKGTKTSLQEGQQYWILTDKNNLVPLSDAAPRPSWWSHLLPPYAEPMQFDTVVCPTPYPISAGDSVGHLGYFQVPKDGGYDSRYQVHIECLSSDDSLPAFLKNPEKVGESAPLYLKCPSGLPLFSKDLKTKAMVSSGKVSQGESILTLSQVKTETDAQKQEYWFLPHANGYVPKTNKSVETLSQYDLEKRGFTTAEDEAPSFDHLDGKTPPKGLVQKVLDWLHHTSSNDTRVTHRVVPLNYKRLLNRIDGSISPYSPHEYLSAIHNPSYRDAKNRMIVKHPSEWYHKKSDPIWLPFLNNLTKDAPEWKTYSEAYIEKMVWMQDASQLKLGSSLWHMHPISFLGALRNKNRITIVYKKYNYTLNHALDKQMALRGDSVPTYGNHGAVTRNQVRDYMDPEAHRDGSEIYQFLDISAPSGVSHEDLSKLLQNKGVLSGKADVFINASKKYKVSEVYLVSHALLETGQGTSSFANGSKTYNGKKVYNMYGIGVFPGNTQNGVVVAYKKGWFSVDEAIDGGAKWISDKFINNKTNQQNTLYKMRWNPSNPGTRQYATAINWALIQKTDMKKMFDQFPDAYLTFEIPVYEKE
ncbi:N-acetylglucosaminidase [Klebsiella quasipneumoniae]